MKTLKPFKMQWDGHFKDITLYVDEQAAPGGFPWTCKCVDFPTTEDALDWLVKNGYVEKD